MYKTKDRIQDIWNILFVMVLVVLIILIILIALMVVVVLRVDIVIWYYFIYDLSILSNKIRYTNSWFYPSLVWGLKVYSLAFSLSSLATLEFLMDSLVL
jgi:hypothetical protein